MGNTIDVLFAYEPHPVKAQEITRVGLTPISTQADGNPLELEEVHTKDIHLIIVSEDLSFFAHEHPEKTGKEYTVDFTFPFGCKFLLYCDVKPLNGLPLVIQKKVDVAGNKRDVQRYQQDVLSRSVDNVSVRLDVQDLSAIRVTIKQGEAVIPASSLGDYLGAKAHVVMINVDTKEYLHVHPMVHKDVLVLHSAFTATGLYRVWIQFLLNGLLYTLDYVVQVAELPGQGLHGHHH
ncbi:hypothetical protein JAO76_17960 [Pontibacter sp. BT310]|uniref:Uncharacterized protein n=1 Tax=Pontibacter populi TaxID=890055 RepID=A0ABS6XH93_9BACT|nr:MULTISPECIES: hypothetical protein [Pontibacter]MBJ6120095.1 hypothetical protein [Pontibacter sp. BT310]MBR0572528.1 hypothetical protein [Microvirga sp. STS03]MBW3366948.1 hypothetical protein [Pontibacter populi]